jgi:hypothetical protein
MLVAFTAEKEERSGWGRYTPIAGDPSPGEKHSSIHEVPSPMTQHYYTEELGFKPMNFWGIHSSHASPLLNSNTPPLGHTFLAYIKKPSSRRYTWEEVKDMVAVLK